MGAIDGQATHFMDYIPELQHSEDAMDAEEQDDEEHCYKKYEGQEHDDEEHCYHEYDGQEHDDQERNDQEQATDASSMGYLPDPEWQHREEAMDAWNKELLENMERELTPLKDTDICSTMYTLEQDKELSLCRQTESLILIATAQLFLRDQLIAALKEINDN